MFIDLIVMTARVEAEQVAGLWTRNNNKQSKHDKKHSSVEQMKGGEDKKNR